MKPNIILMNCDDLGYADVGCYGSTRNQTPGIDSLAENGIRFTDFYAPSPVCTPSRAGMLTGSHPKRIDFQSFGVYDYRRPEKKKDDFVVLLPGQPEGLNPTERTIANLLKDAGYATKLIGKWHVGDQPAYSPLRFGFDSYFGLPYSNDLGLQKPKSDALKRMSYSLCPLPLLEDDQVIQEQPDQASLTERYTQEAIRFIRNNATSPFFLYFAHMYVHHPLFVPQHFVDGSQNGVYGGAVAEIDWSVRALLHELERLGLSENTLFVFTSDNGGDERANNAPLRGYKGSAWEGGIRVNCIMKLPSLIPGGGVCGEIASMLDFYPTFADLAGVPHEDGVRRDGHSMLPLLRGDPGARSGYDAFYYYCGNELQAVRSGKYKLHFINGALYDLENDIGEQTDISAGYPSVVARLQALAQSCREDMGDARTGDIGKNCRPKGFETDFRPYTEYDANHPYMIASYDLEDLK